MKRIHDTPVNEVVATLTQREITADVRERVRDIILNVRSRGDAALCDYSRQFDDVDMGSSPRVMVRAELQEYVNGNLAMLTQLQREAIDVAIQNVTFCAKRSQPRSWKEEGPQGQIVGEKFSAFARVACYVPQGSFPLVSTAIHTAAIARACGVSEIVMITSPSNDDLNIAVAYAAYQSGVTEIVFAGGAQGIAALAYGTQSIARADFICGPGNQYVAEAKRQVFGDVGIDMVAGPSEVYVIADESADAYAVACDLVAQAEHGSGAEAAVLLTDSSDLASRVSLELEGIKDVIVDNPGFEAVWNTTLFLVNVASIDDAVTITNACAPEHVEVITKNASKDAEKIVCAGAVFVGGLSAEPLGDFVLGPSHVLPTNSSARYASGLSAASFYTRTSILECTQQAYDALAAYAYEFGRMEGLTGHAMSSIARLSPEQRKQLEEQQ